MTTTNPDSGLTQANAPLLVSVNQPLSGRISEQYESCPKSQTLVLHARVVSGNGGGPDKTILNSPRHLKRLGFRSACLYLRDPNDSGFEVLRQRASESKAELVEVDDFGILDWKIVSRAREQVRRLKPDIWHGHDYKSNLLGLLLSREHPMKLVTTVHGWVQKTWKTPLYYAIDRRCLPRYDQVICVSQDLFSDCQRLGVAPEKLSLINNAIALEDYAPSLTTDVAKRKLGIATDRRLLVGVGRLSAEKGFDLLIKAVANLNRAGRDVPLAIAGDGDARESLQELISQLDCGDKVKLLGFVKDTQLVYQAADMFVLSSYREGLPNVVLEAMASGVPVLSTNIAGMPTLVEDGVNGKLIEPGSVEALQNSIDELLDDEPQKKRFVEAAYQTIQDRFDFGKRMDKVLEIYQRLGDWSKLETIDPVSTIDSLIGEIESANEPNQAIQVHVEPWSGELPGPNETAWPRLPGHQAAWVNAISKGLGHKAFLIHARSAGRIVGVLPLSLVAGPIFGKFLVSLPYINTGGVWARDEGVARKLIDAACELADELDVKQLELRHELSIAHEKLNFERTDKVHLRLTLPESTDLLMSSLKSKVRSQVKKSQNAGLTVHFGGVELLSDFYCVFAKNMRDLGTPVFSKKLFAEVLNAFGTNAELCVIRSNGHAVAGGLLVHAEGITEVPSASCLRSFNHLNANMFMYWHLLARAIERGSNTFDFGRSSNGSGTFKFKTQWGAQAYPAHWQYYVRKGNPTAMRVDSKHNQRMTKIWKRLPTCVTNFVGPTVVRGIP